MRDLVERTRGDLQRALDDAKLDRQQIDQVLLVGGQTRMPLVQRSSRSFFGKTPHKGVNPDEVVAVGAAIQAAMLVRGEGRAAARRRHAAVARHRDLRRPLRAS